MKNTGWQSSRPSCPIVRRMDISANTFEKALSPKAQRERLRVVCAFWASACCGTLHNSDSDLCGTEIGYTDRLRSFVKPLDEFPHSLGYLIGLFGSYHMTAVKLYHLCICKTIGVVAHCVYPHLTACFLAVGQEHQSRNVGLVAGVDLLDGICKMCYLIFNVFVGKLSEC